METCTVTVKDYSKIVKETNKISLLRNKKIPDNSQLQIVWHYDDSEEMYVGNTQITLSVNASDIFGKITGYEIESSGYDQNIIKVTNASKNKKVQIEGVGNGETPIKIKVSLKTKTGTYTQTFSYTVNVSIEKITGAGLSH